MLNSILFGIMLLAFVGFMGYLAYDAYKDSHKNARKSSGQEQTR